MYKNAAKVEKYLTFLINKIRQIFKLKVALTANISSTVYTRSIDFSMFVHNVDKIPHQTTTMS